MSRPTHHHYPPNLIDGDRLPDGTPWPGDSACVSTPAELDALPVGSVVLDDEGDPWFAIHRHHAGKAWAFDAPDGVVRAGAYLAELNPVPVFVPGRDLLAEAEARGYERGKRDATR
jgi:hypothetical protein